MQGTKLCGLVRARIWDTEHGTDPKAGAKPTKPPVREVR